jgi:hypothetical protein
MHQLLSKSIVSVKGQGRSEHDIGGVVTIDPTLAGMDPLTIRSEAMCGRRSRGRNVFTEPLFPYGRHVDGMVCDQVQTKVIPSIKDITRVRVLHHKVGRNRESTTQRPVGGDFHLIRGLFYSEDHACSIIDISPPPQSMAADVERLVGRLHKIGVSTHSEYLVDDMLLADTSVVVRETLSSLCFRFENIRANVVLLSGNQDPPVLGGLVPRCRSVVFRAKCRRSVWLHLCWRRR